MQDEYNNQVIRQGLNAPYRKIFDAVEENEQLFWELVEEFRGLQVNFPVRLYNAEQVEILVLNEYDGSNADVLAQRYGFSKRWVDNVISKNKQDN
ncbi:hypothetical protein EQG49_05720 [Periweissella cryptocerci]|uniref:Mor transcription activator domain-containing protein n=1 Tax=Periweissella cryptocerci TaxID=2506420 RepID=A0A4P6YTI0_9LACO|nr:Mor transcription activator family protein [Periweissella cryptocerci]QBO35992.1 hypothetical protein EQG49_05720 [Periweissella cryptocerci]